MAYQRRKKKIIDRKLQMRLVGSFLAVGCLAALFQVILLNHSMLELSREMNEVGDEVLAHTPGMLARNVTITLLLLIPVMFVVGVLVTHRIAGPAYRMRMYLGEIAEGGAPSYRCKVRKNDELHELVDSLNDAVEAIVSGQPVAVPEDAGEPPIQAQDEAEAQQAA